MRRGFLVFALASAALVSSCGGTERSNHARRHAAAPAPVAVQVRNGLREALHVPARTGQVAPRLTAAQARPLPFVAVEGCRGPRAAGPGMYVCTTRPRRKDGVSTVIVDVAATGAWSTRPVTVAVTLHGHRVTSAQRVVGSGIRFGR